MLRIAAAIRTTCPPGLRRGASGCYAAPGRRGDEPMSGLIERGVEVPKEIPRFRSWSPSSAATSGIGCETCKVDAPAGPGEFPPQDRESRWRWSGSS